MDALEHLSAVRNTRPSQQFDQAYAWHRDNPLGYVQEPTLKTERLGFKARPEDLQMMDDLVNHLGAPSQSWVIGQAAEHFAGVITERRLGATPVSYTVAFRIVSLVDPPMPDHELVRRATSRFLDAIQSDANRFFGRLAALSQVIPAVARTEKVQLKATLLARTAQQISWLGDSIGTGTSSRIVAAGVLMVAKDLHTVEELVQELRALPSDQLADDQLADLADELGRSAYEFAEGVRGGSIDASSRQVQQSRLEDLVAELGQVGATWESTQPVSKGFALGD